ncbi:1,2-phenylacetyl-CoA epoxidase subunit PaaC [Sphingomicrobium sediminis]|uniref:Phenylacetate-CoA oxygenase subunit PaaC n=1 Tax=Sphingomicrobium sediminis TaxID=2950949 RepID=A0A9X2EFX0_9SPHN|nr:1,2-phenylacetyl-CoA epoxidase subunit PaaC [Sphingomicrobium sediminis]MCM8557238.1 phenylacetate-CoA oxygenase subunit PaaC [Sphingomicrobium sediminis]
MPSLPTISEKDEAKAAAKDGSSKGEFDAPAAGSHDEATTAYVTMLGDDALILGQRLSEWCGHAASVEVDLSLANMGLDLIGQATNWLGLAAQHDAKWADADALAFRRDVLDFRNCLMVEQPNGDFAQTMARQFLFSTWQHMLLERLAGSSDEAIAGIAAKSVKEVAYHRELARDWVVRLGDGTEESHEKMAAGIDWNWRFVPELFEVTEELEELVKRGIAVDPREFEADYRAEIEAALTEGTLAVPDDQRPILGGRRGHHSEHLGHLLAVMQYLPRTYPDAKW